MKKEQLLNLLSVIDDKYVEEAFKRRLEQKRNKNAYLRTAICAAACIALIVGTVFVGKFVSDTDNPSVTTPPPDTTQPITLPSSDFVIENGTLLSYVGKDTEIVLPQEVTTIAADCFSASENAQNITTISLGSNVKMIEEAAFSGLPSLDEITVPEDNKNFVFSEGVLLKTDGSILFAASYPKEIDVQKFVTTIDSMENMIEFWDKEIKFVFDGVTMTAHKSAEDSFFTIDTFTAHGQTFSLADSEYYNTSFCCNGILEVNAYLYMKMSDEAFIYSKGRSSIGYYLIITKDAIYEYLRPEEVSDPQIEPEWYNKSTFTYSIDDNGRLTYTREPLKYTFDQTIYHEMKYCVGFDEFALEEGYVTFDSGEVVHHAEKRYTVSERINLYECFNTWYDSYKNYSESMLAAMGLPRVNTLDELLRYNSQHYKPAE